MPTELKIIHEWESLTDTAKRARKELKAEFPGVKFSVRTERFAGGDAINIRWTDGPAERTVDQFAQRYQGYQADETGDFMDPKSPQLLANADGTYTMWRSGAKFVFAKRELSEAARKMAEQVVEDWTGEPYDAAKLYQWSTMVDDDGIVVMYPGGETWGCTLVHQLCALAQIEQIA